MLKAMVFLSATFAFLLSELFFFITTRLYQVRAEFINWSDVSEMRRRILFLVLGLWFFMGFAMIQRVKATHAWVANHWVLSGSDRITMIYLLLGMIGVLMLLWWVFGAVFVNHGKKIWWISLALGILVGASVLLYDLIDEGLTQTMMNLFQEFLF